MPALAYLVHGSGWRQQQELSYSILSALKHGTDGIRLLLICDAQNRRSDLPVETLELPSETLASWSGRALARLHALQHLAAQEDTPVCLIATDTDFKAPPAGLFGRIAPAQAVMHACDGWIGTEEAWGGLIEKCRGTDLEALVHPDAELMNSGVTGLHPAMREAPSEAIALAGRLGAMETVPGIANFAIGAVLAQKGQIAACADLVTRYGGHMRHVYHGRFARMFPEGRAVNTVLAAQLPAVTEPPKPLALRLRARAYGLRTGAGPGTQAGYLAYLCALSAPNAEGRNVWANIALDHLEHSRRAPELLARDMPQFASAALADAGLEAGTAARWRAFWAGPAA